ncbi:cytochrome c [Cupriavidus sp. OV038]|jgi:cytochrome c|uniref:c-type cytochrome n=1 Tax=unclassified Cupriavidus TaxID=2640874 RepID=UPI0008EC2EB5|nr:MULTISPECIES: cytochrome c family protein [unclassified Cupriavidus]SFD05402.1 cytochrome c [Cupriavidus sp. OV038]SFP71778.1 cytochrome c [Cupriavidus sp. OV096]
MRFPLIALTACLVMQASAHAAGDIETGRAVFDRKCASCHKIGPAARGTFGPHLNGIVGRPAGTTSDYRYSDAMKTSKVVWTSETLRAFIHAPNKVVPGNKMRFWGIGDDSEITDLLAFLQTVR